MKRFGLLLLSILAISLLLGGSALAQNVGDNSTFFVTYFSNNNVASPHAVARFINDGDTGAGPDPVGDLWAAIYVFDDSEELTECCACTVTADMGDPHSGCRRHADKRTLCPDGNRFHRLEPRLGRTSDVGRVVLL
jgi:hypothetical protein